MNTRTCDVAVIGLGVTGAAAAWQLARRGARVVAFDRFAPPHPFGSSHGRTRIIREAYFEGEAYVPLVRRAYDSWRELEQEYGQTLYRRTGGLTLAPEGRGIVARARSAGRAHGLELETLDAAEMRHRFPDFRVSDEDVGVWEPRAGVLQAERAVAALLQAADRAGAELRFGVGVDGWIAENGGALLRTSRGDSISAGRVVLAAGPWIGRLLPGARPPLEVERSVVHWFEPATSSLDPLGLPVFIEELEGGRLWYGIPEEGLFKTAFHHGGEVAGADTLRREVSTKEVQAVRRLLRLLIPAAAGAYRASEVCPYTNLPDGDFLIDLHPEHSQAVIASACSGHGFKFAPVTGALAADLALDGQSAALPDSFRWRWS